MWVFLVMAAVFAVMTAHEIHRAVRMVRHGDSALAAESAGSAALMASLSLMFVVLGRRR